MARVSSDTNAAVARVSMQRSPTHSFTPLAQPPSPVLPLLAAEEEDSTDWQKMPSNIAVHSVNNVVALSSQQLGLANLAWASCAVSVKHCITVSVSSFLPLAPVVEVSPKAGPVSVGVAPSPR